jgi:pimeloyl-ACP methyl ester carboxylesterase
MNGRKSKPSAGSPTAGRRGSRLRTAVPDWIEGGQVFMPQGYEAGYDYPLLVWLAGDDDAFDLGRAMARTSLRNFVAVHPAADPAGTVDRDERIWRAIDAVRDRLSIHADRIFLVGQGDGGTAAFRFACRHPDAFAGVVSIGGRFPLDESLFARLHEVRRMPMLLCCRAAAAAEAAGNTDRTLRLFHAAGAMLAMRIYPGANDLSRAILGDVNRWLMEEICGSPATLQSECTR